MEAYSEFVRLGSLHTLPIFSRILFRTIKGNGLNLE